MFTLHVDAMEVWNDETEEFINCKPVTLQLEHSLVSISKWEAVWEKPFLETKLEDAALRDYIRCMTVNSGVDPNVYALLPTDKVLSIKEYIESKRTATTINRINTGTTTGRKNGEGITSELIYYWMINYNIPMECQKWHLNRLLTLIEICSVKSEPPKKMSARELASRNANLNAARRKALGTKG